MLFQLTLMSPVAAKKLVSVWNLNPQPQPVNYIIIANFGLCSGVNFFFKSYFFCKILWFLNFGELFPKNL